jgi:Fe2+ or Zn2+ uptake regulation protein
MDRNTFILNLLLENFRFECKYYQGDEEPCLREENHLACNCCGRIKDCDLKIED